MQRKLLILSDFDKKAAAVNHANLLLEFEFMTIENGFVIIPCYNGKDLLKSCISSIRRSRGRWNIVLVDNCSSDGTGEVYRDEPGIVYLENKKNYGFGVACNTGIEFALKNRAQAVAILNQDAIVTPDCLDLLASSINKSELTGIACPIIVNSQYEITPAFAGWISRDATSLLHDAFFSAVKMEYRVPFVNAACWMINVEALRRVGGFDPIFFMYGEDKELAARYMFHGYHMTLNTKAVLIHETQLRAVQDSFWKRINWLSVRPLSNMLTQMRNYHRPYWRCLPSVVANWINGFVANLLARNAEHVLGYLVAAMRFPSLILENWRHHQLCRVCCSQYLFLGDMQNRAET